MQRLKLLSKLQKNIQWKSAVKTILVVILAALLSSILGFAEGTKIVVIITLMAAIIVDTPLPLSTVIKIEIICALMMMLAFVCVGLSANIIPLFILFTALWSFFSLSMYIFGDTYGNLGFLFFTTYFIAVITVTPSHSPLQLGLYIVFAYLIASIILIPKMISNKNNMRKIIARGFLKETRFRDMLATRVMLSGIKLDPNKYHLFNLGFYLTALIDYSYKIRASLSKESCAAFTDFIASAETSGEQIYTQVTLQDENVDLSVLNDKLNHLKKEERISSSKQNDKLKLAVEVADIIENILEKSQSILPMVNGSGATEKIKISSPFSSLQGSLKSNFNLNNIYMRHTIRFTIAMIISLLIVNFHHSRDVIWVAMGILIIMKPDISSTRDNFILRVFFNFLGVIMALILGIIFPQHLFVWLGLLMLFFFRAFYPGNMGPAVMALTIFVVLMWPTSTLLDNAMARVIDLTLGGIIAFIMTYLVLPNRITINLPLQTVKTLHAASDYLQSIMITAPDEYNRELSENRLKIFILEYNNLEASLKKLQDSYKDVENDVNCYENIASAIYSLVSDGSLLATQINLKREYLHKQEIDYLSEGLLELSKTIANNNNNNNGDRENTSPETTVDFKRQESYLKHPTRSGDNLGYLIQIIKLDFDYLAEEILEASQNGLFKKYRKLI